MKRATKDALVLSYLEEHKEMTAETGIQMGFTDLASAISRLRKEGYNIRTVSEKRMPCTYIYNPERRLAVTGMFKVMQNPIF
jgi:hypothetical protein